MLGTWKWVIASTAVLAAVIAYVVTSRTSNEAVLLLLFGAVCAFLASIDARTHFIMGKDL